LTVHAHENSPLARSGTAPGSRVVLRLNVAARPSR
jgi:hypothetical protein